MERREHLDLAAIASKAVLARESEAAGRDLDVRATLAPAPAAGDPRLVERLIANLIDNAIRHNIPEGHIEITTGTRDRARIPGDRQQRPDDPPRGGAAPAATVPASHGTRTNHASGNGLGLAIVDAIAAAHRATLTAQPRPGGGLTSKSLSPPHPSTRSRSTRHRAARAGGALGNAQEAKA